MHVQHHTGPVVWMYLHMVCSSSGQGAGIDLQIWTKDLAVINHSMLSYRILQHFAACAKRRTPWQNCSKESQIARAYPPVHLRCVSGRSFVNRRVHRQMPHLQPSGKAPWTAHQTMHCEAKMPTAHPRQTSMHLSGSLNKSNCVSHPTDNTWEHQSAPKIIKVHDVRLVIHHWILSVDLYLDHLNPSWTLTASCY